MAAPVASGHYLAEEAPEAVIDALQDFFAGAGREDAQASGSSRAVGTRSDDAHKHQDDDDAEGHAQQPQNDWHDAASSCWLMTAGEPRRRL